MSELRNTSKRPSAAVPAPAASEAQPVTSIRPRPLKFPSNNDPTTASTPRALELRKQAQDRLGRSTSHSTGDHVNASLHKISSTTLQSSSDSLLPPSPTSHSSSGTFEANPIVSDVKNTASVDRSQTTQRAAPGTETPPEVWHAFHQSESSTREQPRRNKPIEKETNHVETNSQSAKQLEEMVHEERSPQQSSRIQKEAIYQHSKNTPRTAKADFQKEEEIVSMDQVEDKDLTVLNAEQLEFVDKFVRQKKAEDNFAFKTTEDKEVPVLNPEQQHFVDTFARQKEALRLEHFEREKAHSKKYEKSANMKSKSSDATAQSTSRNADKDVNDALLMVEKPPSKEKVTESAASSTSSSTRDLAAAPISEPSSVAHRRQRQEQAAALKIHKLREDEEKADHKRFQEETRLVAEIEFQMAETKRDQELADVNNARRREQRDVASKTRSEGRMQSSKQKMENNPKSDKEKKTTKREASKRDNHHQAVSNTDYRDESSKIVFDGVVHEGHGNLSQHVMTAAGQTLFDDYDDSSMRTTEGLTSNSESSGWAHPGPEVGLHDKSLAEHMDGLLCQINYRQNMYNIVKENMLWNVKLYSVPLWILLGLSTCLSLLAASGYISVLYEYYAACVVSGLCAVIAGCLTILRDMQEFEKKARCFEEAEGVFRALARKLRTNWQEVCQGRYYCSFDQHVREAFILKYETVYEEILIAQDADSYHVDSALVLEWVASRKLTYDEDINPLDTKWKSNEPLKSSKPRQQHVPRVPNHNAATNKSRKHSKRRYNNSPRGYSSLQENGHEDTLESGKSSTESQDELVESTNEQQWYLLAGFDLKEYDFTDNQDDRYLRDVRRLVSQVYVRKNLFVLTAQKCDFIELVRFKLPILLLIASLSIISFLASSRLVGDKNYKLNSAACVISIICQVCTWARHTSSMDVKADMARRAGKQYALLGTKLERLIGEHRSASSLMSAVSASNDAANSSKILAAERAKFVGACVRAVEHLQRYEEHFHAGTGLLLRSHDTIVSKWLGRGDVLPQRGDHQEYAPNLMSHEYVLAALFLSEPS